MHCKRARRVLGRIKKEKAPSIERGLPQKNRLGADATQSFKRGAPRKKFVKNLQILTNIRGEKYLAEGGNRRVWVRGVLKKD